jgi:TRAP-type C4-dicarboxylate transport system substrate-binding protein
MEKRRFIILSGVCVVLLFVMLFMTQPYGPVKAAEKKPILWKFSTMENPGSLFFAVENWWAREFEKRSGGRIKVEVYGLDQLCGPKEMVEAVFTGIADVVIVAPGYYPGKTPLSSIYFLPFATSAPRVDQMTYAANLAGAHPNMLREYDQFNSIYAFMVTGPHFNIMSKVPIKTVDDFKGLRIRAIGDMAPLFRKFGATPISCPAPEIYTSLERGLFDAAVCCGDWCFDAWRIHEGVKGGYYIQGFDMCPCVGVGVISKNSYNKLPKDLQQIVEDLKWEMSAVNYEHLESPAVLEYFAAKFKRFGIKYSTFPPAERAKMLTFAKELHDAWKERYKQAGAPEFFDAYQKANQEAVKKYPNGIYKERPLPSYIKEVLEKL